LSKLAHTLLLRVRTSLPVSGSLALDPEQAFHDLFWGTHPRGTVEHCGHGGHSLAVGFLALVESHGCALVGWSIGIPLPSTAATKWSRLPVPGALLIKGVKILSRIPQNLLQAALGDRNSGKVGDRLDGFGEGILRAALTKRSCSS
jgi:hypothetical protein